MSVTQLIGLFIIVLLQLHSSGRASDLDFSYVECSAEIEQLIQENIPQAIKKAWMFKIDPQAYASFLEITYYREHPSDSSDSALLIYVTDGFGKSELQLYERSQGTWHILSRTSALGASSVATLRFADLNCDGVSEIIVENPTGMSGYFQVEIVGVREGQLIPLTKLLFGGQLIGRTVSLHEEGGCVRAVEVTEDGPEKFVIGRRMVYELDRKAGKFRFVREEKME